MLQRTNADILLVGATGLVGSHVLQQALADPRVRSVVAPTRRELPAHPKVRSPRIDYEKFDEHADWWRADAVICTLGTTIRTAGSQAAFRHVDHDYPLQVARLAYAHGTRTYALNSSTGADAGSRVFYLRVKGELENDLRQIGFDSLTLVRPGAIGGDRQEHRPGERFMVGALSVLGPVLPARWRLNPAENIAKGLLEAALAAKPGVGIVAAQQLV